MLPIPSGIRLHSFIACYLGSAPCEGFHLSKILGFALLAAPLAQPVRKFGSTKYRGTAPTAILFTDTLEAGATVAVSFVGGAALEVIPVLAHFFLPEGAPAQFVAPECQ